MEKITLKELKKFIKAEAKRLNSDMEDVPQWVLASAVRFFNEKVNDPEKKILEMLSHAISNDEFGDDKHIVEFLRNADEKTLDKQAHGYEFEAYAGCNVEIIMWEPLEHYTLRMLYEHIGL